MGRSSSSCHTPSPVAITFSNSGPIVSQISGQTSRAGRPPGREVIDGALVLAGGLLLIVPGFITDVLGLVLLAPTRKLAREVIARNFQSRLVVAATRFSREPRSRYDVDSTATDLDGPQLHG